MGVAGWWCAPQVLLDAPLADGEQVVKRAGGIQHDQGGTIDREPRQVPRFAPGQAHKENMPPRVRLTVKD